MINHIQSLPRYSREYWTTQVFPTLVQVPTSRRAIIYYLIVHVAK